MRLYTRPIAPNALKVVIFMTERGIQIETVDVGELTPEEYEVRYLAGERFTMADLTAFLGWAGLVGWRAIEPRPGPALGRWLGEVGARPSMAPLRALAAQFDLPSV